MNDLIKELESMKIIDESQVLLQEYTQGKYILENEPNINIFFKYIHDAFTRYQRYTEISFNNHKLKEKQIKKNIFSIIDAINNYYRTNKNGIELVRFIYTTDKMILEYINPELF